MAKTMAKIRNASNIEELQSVCCGIDLRQWKGQRKKDLQSAIVVRVMQLQVKRMRSLREDLSRFGIRLDPLTTIRLAM
jgi:hypothetical protein